MALPRELLEAQTAATPPQLAWTTVRDPTLVLGRSARAPALNEAAVRARAVTVASRRSGGAPVLWDPDLLGLDIVLPADHPLADRDVTAAYRWLGEAVHDGLTRLGVPCSVVDLAAARALQARGDDVSRRAARACFGGVSPYEVLAADGRKVVGLSQARRRQGALFQCGIALCFDAATLAELFEADPGERTLLAQALRSRAAGIRDWVPEVTADDVVEAVEDALGRRHGVRFTTAG